MKTFKSFLMLAFIAISFQNCYGVIEEEWDGSSDIPNNGNIYYVTSLVTLESDLTINGILEVRTSGQIQNDFTITVNTTGIFRTNSSSAYITNIGTINVNGGSIEVITGYLFNGYVTYSGTLNLNSGSIKISGGQFRNAYQVNSTTNINGGIMRFSGGTFYNGYGSGGIGTINIYQNGVLLSCGGTFYNNYDNTSLKYGVINLHGGRFYIHDQILNGNSGDPGEINIYHGGGVFVLGSDGEIQNGDASSEINIYTGGSLYNYYGEVDLALGSLEVHEGAKFDNVRGNNPGSFTTNTGANFSDGLEIYLDRNLYIDCIWTLTDVSVINGNGHEITFGPNGAIVISGATASLLLQDVVINDVSGTKIRGTDTNSTLSIDNVVWNQDGDFTFGTGIFEVLGNWLISGKWTKFNYTSDQTSEIKENGTMHFLFTTLNYNTGTSSRIAMEDTTSVLHLEQATILATQSYDIEYGTLVITGLGTLDGSAATIDLSGIDDINIAGSITEIGTVTLP